MIPFFRLIDCQSRKVITTPPDSEYVALSYVWGAEQTFVTDTEDKQLSDVHSCPKAISDSLQVTSDIGFKYLWVDKYCINQGDDQDKEIQIQMGLIYANAMVTIIAATGKGPHHGLPGVAGTLRKTQPALRIGDYHIAASLSQARHLVWPGGLHLLSLMVLVYP